MIQTGKLWRICFRGSIHGFSRASFFKECGSRESTLLVVKTPNGYLSFCIDCFSDIFGGYNEAQWDRLPSTYRAFLFSLENKFHKPPTIMFPTDPKYGCARSSSHGTLFL